MRTECVTEAEFVARFQHDCDESSVFVATEKSLTDGADLAFSLELADGQPMLRGLGVVLNAWPTAHNRFGRVGVHVGFIQLTTASAAVLDRLLMARAHAEAAGARRRIATMTQRRYALGPDEVEKWPDDESVVRDVRSVITHELDTVVPNAAPVPLDTRTDHTTRYEEALRAPAQPAPRVGSPTGRVSVAVTSRQTLPPPTMITPPAVASARTIATASTLSWATARARIRERLSPIGRRARELWNTHVPPGPRRSGVSAALVFVTGVVVGTCMSDSPATQTRLEPVDRSVAVAAPAIAPSTTPDPSPPTAAVAPCADATLATDATRPPRAKPSRPRPARPKPAAKLAAVAAAPSPSAATAATARPRAPAQLVPNAKPAAAKVPSHASTARVPATTGTRAPTVPTARAGAAQGAMPPARVTNKVPRLATAAATPSKPASPPTTPLTKPPLTKPPPAKTPPTKIAPTTASATKTPSTKTPPTQVAGSPRVAASPKAATATPATVAKPVAPTAKPASSPATKRRCTSLDCL